MSSTPVAPSPIRAHAAPVPAAVSQHRGAVARWALASGRPAHRDALAAVVGVRAEHLGAGAALDEPTEWTVEHIGELLWVGISSWCVDRYAHVPAPADVSRTLDTYLRYLSANRLLARGSDPVAALRRAISDYGGGRSQMHPAVRHRRLAPVVPIG